MFIPRLTAAACLALASVSAGMATAQELPLYDASQFGKVIVAQQQSALPAPQYEALIGNGSLELIADYNPASRMARLGRAVGKLDILTDLGGYAPCTAFLVAGNRLVTNHHCVPGVLDHPKVEGTVIAAVQFHAGFTQDGIRSGVTTYQVSPVPLETNKELDYTVLQVIGDANGEFGALELSAELPRDADPLFVIGHPQGWAQRLSREKCATSVPAVEGNRVRHSCDTMPGNSGSPVFDDDRRQVVALHSAASGPVNLAVPMAQILAQSKVLTAATPAALSPDSGPSDAERKLAEALAELERLRAAQKAAEVKPDPPVVAAPFSAPVSEPVPEPVPVPDTTPVGVPVTGPVTGPVAEPKPVTAALGGREILRQTQAQLNALGCNAGTPDGVMGPRTREAFRRFQAETGGALALSDLGTPEALEAVKARSGVICKAPVSVAPVATDPKPTSDAPAAPVYSMTGTWRWTATCPLGQASGTTVFRSAGGESFTGTINGTSGSGTTRGALSGRNFVATETIGWFTNTVTGRLSLDGRTLSTRVSNGCTVTVRKN